MTDPLNLTPPPTTLSPAGASPPAGGPPPPPEQVSPKLAALMRKEAEAVRQMRAAKTLEGQIKAREEAIAAREAKNEQIERLWKENPLKALQERGYDYNQLTMMQLNNGQMTPEMQLRQLQQEIQTLRQEKDQERSQSAEQQKAAADAELAAEEKRFQSEIESQLEVDKEKFPLTHLYKRADLIYAQIDQHFQKTLKETGVGAVLEFDKASQLVEDAILKEATKAQDILSKRTAQAAQETATRAQAFNASRQTQSQWVEKPVKTLAGLQQSVPSQPTNRPLSDDDRVANALARLRAMKQR